MRRNILGIILLLSAGCSQLPQWNTTERQAAEAELENAQTQLEMNSAMAAIAANAEERMLAALEYKYAPSEPHGEEEGMRPASPMVRRKRDFLE